MELACCAAKPSIISTDCWALRRRSKNAGHFHAPATHLACFSSSPSSPSWAEPAPAPALLLRDELLLLISDQKRGLISQKEPAKRAQIIRCIDSLAALGAATATTSHQALSATWRMLWTTEKEQLFIIEKAHLFGTQAGDILQVIDVERKKLNNIITFPPDGAFLVDSTIEVVSSQRVNFRFIAATLRGSGWNIPVPPFGQGWFDSVYIDEKIRVAKDIRGDYLVVDRAPYTWDG